jgi:hypothetical protein
MRYNRRTTRRAVDRGAAAAELALLLPFLGTMFLATIDFARLFYHYNIVTNCARNGGVYASDPFEANESPYANSTDAAQADASNLSPQPTVSTSSGSDSYGSYMDVTVSYPFQTLCTYPGLSNPITLSRTVRVRVAPTMPN